MTISAGFIPALRCLHFFSHLSFDLIWFFALSYIIMRSPDYRVLIGVGMGLCLLFAFYSDYVLFRAWKSDFNTE